MLYYLLIISVVSVFTCVYDKIAAKRKWRRVREAHLHLLSILGGAFFMYLTMLAIRHKTKHLSFMIVLPIMIVLHATLIIAYYIFLVEWRLYGF